jgi:hypothetical protein
MPKPRTKFPYWNLACELEAAEGISIAEAVQRVVESTVEDAVDNILGHREKGFWAVRSAKISMKKCREVYDKHHPRMCQKPDVDNVPSKAKSPTSEVASLLDSQMVALAQWRQSKASDKS